MILETFLRKNIILLVMIGSSCCVSAQKFNKEPQWQSQYDSLIKYYYLRDFEHFSSYAEDLYTKDKYQIHDSLRVTIGAMYATFIKDENQALNLLNINEKKFLKTNDRETIIGSNYFYKADWYYNNSFDKKALDNYYKADSIFTSIDDKSFVSIMTLVGICDVLMKSNVKEESLITQQVLPYIETGIKRSDETGFMVPKAIFLYKKGDLYYNEGDFKKSEHFYKQALKISEDINNNTRQSLIFNQLSKIAIKRNLLDSALIYQKKAVEKAIGLTDYIVISDAHLNLGIVYNKIKNYDKAIERLNHSKILLQKSKFTRKEPYHDIAYNLAQAYFGKNEFEKAYTYLESAKQLETEAQLIKNIEKVEEIEANFQNDKKEQEIDLLKTQNKLVEQQKKQQRNQLFIGLGITTLAGLFFFFLYRNRQKTTKKLQELDKAKSAFFTNISHEFRTPLTLISGPIQSMLAKQNVTEEDKSNLEMIDRNSTRLLSLVDQLLNISKIKAGHLKLKVSENNLITFIGVLANGFIYKAKQKTINYVVENNLSTSKTFYSADIVEKIIINLISNAIKYTPQNGSIVCTTKIENGKLYFTVKNTGEGLSKQEINTIFERFYQINENATGVGIGLALVKELAILHKGSISVKSVPNKWTTFKLILPITENDFTKGELDISNTSHPKKITTAEAKTINISDIDHGLDENDELPILLIVDDNKDIRTYIKSLFKTTHNILVAKNGEEGIELALNNVPDIIISDIMMPVKNGIELCNTLKVDERTSHIPIVLLTAKAGEENEIEGIKTGADDYITKPFNEALLKLKIEKLLESRKKLQLRYSQDVILRPKDIAISTVDEQFLERVQNILDHRLVESSFNVNDFSEAIGMSRMQLHRKVKALTGLSAATFIRSQRLKLAGQLLLKSDVNVSEIGFKVGFNNHAYFSKCFKEMYYCSPSEYVKNNYNK